MKESYKHLVKVSFMAVVAALALRAFGYDGYRVSSHSMAPTLVAGDFLLASKASYGYGPFSFPGAGWFFSGQYDKWQDPPARGDVIVFRHPRIPNYDCVKRVMGIAGDVIHVREGIVYVNDFPCPLEKAGTHGNGLTLYRETMPSGRQHFIFKDKPLGQGDHDNMPPIKIPQGMCFVMGDNRDRSQDSYDQVKMGFIPYQNLIGRADAFFSLGHYY